MTDETERRYPAFSPDDDDFHDEQLSDRWWESETNWFSWNVPERRMGGWTYGQARPNARLCNGGVWLWDDSAALSWELPYHVHYSGLQLPDRSVRDMRDFEWPTGVHVKMLEPLTKYAIDYDDAPDLEVHLEFDAIMAPNPHPVGVAPFVKGTHFDQAGRLTGEVVLRGERIRVDCYSVRDRSWGPRPMGRPRRRPGGASDERSRAGGIGYSFGVAGPRDAWLVYSVPRVDDDPVVCGFLLRAGEYAHILRGAAPAPRRHRDGLAGRDGDRGGRRRRPAPRGRGRGREPALARQRRRHAVPLAVGRPDGLGRGPDVLQSGLLAGAPGSGAGHPMSTLFWGAQRSRRARVSAAASHRRTASRCSGVRAERAMRSDSRGSASRSVNRVACCTFSLK